MRVVRPHRSQPASDAPVRQELYSLDEVEARGERVAGKERRDGEKELVHELGGDELPKQRRTGLGDDHAVTARDIADYHLILFGDPGSNTVIARLLERLPIRWSKTEIAVGARTFSATDHIPVLIYPNPLNPKRYVVINSGHTFGESDFRGTNAWLYPRLGDYSVLTADGDIAVSGFFDERWQLK